VITRPSEREVPSSRLVAGKYRLIELLGRGAMGAVWRAEHLTLHSQVAVKLLASQDPTLLPRFLREAKAAAALRSPHVVQIMDHGVDGAFAFIVMELLEGETLGQRLKRDKTLSPEATFRVMLHIARGVAKAHAEGIVHRDLKPDNVFLVKNDDEEIAKVLDFGVAKWAEPKEGDPVATRSGVLLGTPA
jgi:serine/threonine-protein kinase